MRRLIRVYTLCIKYRNFYKIMVVIKTNRTPCLLEMNQSKEFKQKSPLGINGLVTLKNIFIFRTLVVRTRCFRMKPQSTLKNVFSVLLFYECAALEWNREGLSYYGKRISDNLV